MLKFSGRTYDLSQSTLSVRFLKLISTVVSAENAAGLVFSCAAFGAFSKWVFVPLLSWLLLAGSVSSGLFFSFSTSFSEGLYALSFLDL